MTRGLTRAERLREMERLYVQHSFSDIEMAERLGVNRATVWDDRLLLEGEVPFIKDADGRHRIDRNRYLSAIRVNLHEALALYLAARRMSRQTRIAQPHIAEALSKLAGALRQPMTERLIKAADHILSQNTAPQRTAILETVAKAWVENRKVEITYSALQSVRPRVHVVYPYLIEPSLWSDSNYVIAFSEQMGKVVPFKTERILEAHLRGETFNLPADFDEETLLRHAWGVWYSESKPTLVKLRFAPGPAADRVRETIWHPLQERDDTPDGGCIWAAAVDEWREMLPWVRGWGADVEVLEPADLREEVSLHVHKMATIYGLTVQASDPSTRLRRLWGKTTPNSDIFHPALYHMLDVAHVAQQLLSPPASPRWRRILARALNCDADALAGWLPWFIALHDIGKISVPFQVQNTAQKERLLRENFNFGRYTADHKALHHTLMGRLVLKEWATSFPYAWRTVFLDMVAGHHGECQQPEGVHHTLHATLREPDEWAQLRQQAIEFLRQRLLRQEPSAWPEPDNLSAAIVALNGFTILCDWLGSDADYFTPRPYTSMADYLTVSREKAARRVESAGFFTPASSPAPTAFAELFHWSPRPLQQAIDHIPDHLLVEPTLTIIEAPTGEGKTEAALTLAHRIARQQGTDEMYLALPTTATSNAMFTRLQAHLQQRLLLPPTLVKLVHGQSFLVEDDLRIAPLDNGDGLPHPAFTWFAPQKKSLLAPFGVGTVDQAELAALNVRHNALRLVGLAGKVVILDEVHAYDTYMTTIIARMLQWLAAMGASVILLSATLPTARRQQLAAAYTGGQIALEKTDAYPYLLTVNRAAIHSANPPAAQPGKTIFLHTLHFAETDWTGKAAWLLRQTENGGCVCWIANTVERAQRTFQALQAIAPDDVDCTLLHARFPLAARQVKEQEIGQKYSNDNAHRPRKGVVIGTQVLEQSLDIDFDLMVSDLAPIDLLLQRIGRLHRHDRPDRAAAHPEPHVYINYELDDNQQPRMGDDRFYTPYILLKTWQVIAQKAAMGQLNLPQDYRPLIETVYDQTTLAATDALYDAWTKRRRQESKLEDEARLRLTNAPDADDPFYEGDKRLWKEDEESAAWVVAQTRYQERESLTVIPLERLDEDTGQIPGAAPLFLYQPASREMQLHLLQHSLRLTHPELVKHLKAAPLPPLFSESPLLQRCYPLWLHNDRGIDLPVHLDSQLGLLIEKE